MQLSKAEVQAVFRVWGVKSVETAGVAILAVRDWDGDGNEIGAWDDRAFVLTKGGAFKEYRFNTDPSSYVNGRAQMETGQVVSYRAGKHKLAYGPPRGYAAFRQKSRAYFRRKGSGREFANIAANLHKGSASGGTSSLACQTVPVELWIEFRDAAYAALGVTASQVLASPMGTGPEFQYLILSQDEVRAALKKGEAMPTQGIAESEKAPAFTYLLPDGRKIPETIMAVGVGYAPTRATMALLLNTADAAGLKFRFTPDTDDADDDPDLLFVDNRGGTHPIECLDESESRTFGKLTDMATAAGLTWTIDNASKVVQFTRKPVA